MSNKERLQANNTKLASLIQTLQGKAAGGGGGTLNYSFYIYEEIVTIPDGIFEGDGWKAAWICPLGEIDFATATMENLDTLYGLSDGTELAIAAPIWQLFGVEKDFFSYMHIDAYGQNLLYLMANDNIVGIVLMEMTEDRLSTLGIDGEPGVYALNSPLLGMPGPAIMMRIGS